MSFETMQEVIDYFKDSEDGPTDLDDEEAGMISFYHFTTLQEVIDYFKDQDPSDIKIGGAFGREEPAQDDDPIFFWEE